MACPLPIDWLDWLDDSAAGPALSEHLRTCVSCKTVISALTRDVGGMPRLRPAVTTAVGVYDEESGGSPAAGDLWVTAAPDEGLDGALVLVLNGRHEEYGRVWYEIAAVGTDVENAVEIDLLLQAAEASLAVPLRVRFDLQGFLAAADFGGRVGQLTAAGSEVIAEALHGSPDESRWGLPVEGPHDQRLASDRAAASLRQLQLLYRTYAAAAEDAELSLARVVTEARTDRRLARAQLADRLAAALGVAPLTAKVKRYYADLESGLLNPEGLRPTVITELARILAVPRQQLEGLQSAWIPPASTAQAPAFARTASPAATPPATRAGEEWDAVDDLFRGERL